MVLTRRAHKARMLITRWLPNEVLVEVIRHSPQVDRVALCRVSKLFHGLTLPTLLRDILLDLDTPDKLACLCRSIIRDPERAAHIRAVRLRNSSEHNAKLWHYDLLIDAMKLMQQVEAFHFSEYREIATEIVVHVEEMGMSTIRNLTEHLPSFTDLVYLALDSPDSDQSSVMDTFGDQQTAKTWGKSCPTLKTCLIGDTAWRKMGEDWDPYPTDEFLEEAGFSAFASF